MVRSSYSILFALFFLTTVGFSQPKLLDSLKTSLRNHPQSDTVRFDLLISLVRATRIDKPDSAIAYGKNAVTLSNQLKIPKRQVQALNLLGTAYYFKGDFTQAITTQREALEVCKQNQVSTETGNVLSSLALALQSHAQYTEAIETFFEALRLEEQSKNERNIIKISTNLGILYRNLADYDNANRHAFRSYRLLKANIPDWYPALASATNTIGLNYQDQHRYDSAIIFLKEAYLYNKISNNITYTANSASNITYCFLETNGIDSASHYIKLALRDVDKISNKYVKAGILINAGAVQLKHGNLSQAEQLTQQGVQLSKEVESKETILTGYRTLAEIFKQQNKLSLAYDYFQRAYSINDSLKSFEAHQQAANVERDYEIKKRQERIDAMAQEASLNEMQLKNEQQLRYYLLFIVLLLVIAAGFAYYSFRTKAKSNKRLQAKNEEIAGKNELLESVNRNLQDQALRGQMKPHFIFNALNSIQFLIVQKENDKAFEYLSKFSQLLRSALEFSNENFIDLEKELKWLDLYVKLEGLRFNHQFDFAIQFDNPESEFKGLQLPPFIVQPFIENAIAHGLMPKTGDRKLMMSLSRANGALCVKINDNGVGREQSTRQKSESGKRHRSFGMEIVKKRLEILSSLTGKSYTFQVSDGVDEKGNKQGTSVALTFPASKNLTPEP